MSDLPTSDSIRAEAAAAGLTIAQMCRLAGVVPAVFHRWCNGTSPRLRTVAKWQAVIREAAGAAQSKGTEDGATEKGTGGGG